MSDGRRIGLRDVLKSLPGTYCLTPEQYRDLRETVHREVERVAKWGDSLALVGLAEAVVYGGPALENVHYHDTDMERQALGSILLDPVANGEWLEVLEDADLWQPFHRLTLRGMKAMKDQACDVRLVACWVRENRDIASEVPNSHVAEAIAEVVRSVAVPHHARHYVLGLRRVRIKRERQDVARELLRLATVDKIDAVEWLKVAKERMTELANLIRTSRKTVEVGA